MGLIKRLFRANRRQRKKQRVLQANPHAREMAALGWDESGSVQRRAYPSYEAYAEHQKAKLGHRNLTRYDPHFTEALERRLALLVPPPSGSVLCLGARSGAECAAFIKLGCFAVGIDLNPGTANRYVVTGDFHDLQYADGSLDVVYTNSLDHAFDLDRILKQVARVLKDGGRFIAEIVDPGQHGPGDYEATWWSSVDDVVGVIERGGFSIVGRTTFDQPWQGTQVVFVKTPVVR
ncbi:MAG TPA: class I SAM-dependent methyltransferase [Dongiaceae bacterium]|nr:class I SAM-dependent methyltransferase [Dongiaceae bacterium]